MDGTSDAVSSVTGRFYLVLPREVIMRHAFNLLVMAIAALAFLSVLDFDVRWVVAAVFAALGVGAVFDSFWGN